MPASSGLRIPEYTDYSELQGNHQAFVDRYLELGDSIKAAAAAGYKDSNGFSLKQKANKLRRFLAHIIDQRMEEYAKGTDMALLGVNVLKELAHNADSETVRLNAAKEIVNRCMAPAAQKKEVTHKVQVSSLTNEELDKRIAALQQELTGNVIDVTPEKATDA